MNLKSLLRWLVRLLTVAFLGRALLTHWQEVVALKLRDDGPMLLLLGAAVTLGAHVWAGVVWNWLLGAAGYSQPVRWAMVTYLRTNVAKYLPGNVWHFFRRVQACQERQIPLGAAVLSVVLEALLMMAAACLIACSSFTVSAWKFAPLLPLLVLIHPRLLNPILTKLAAGKAKTFGRLSKEKGYQQGETSPALVVRLHGYPALPLAGELGFVALRGAGFVLCLSSLHPTDMSQLPAVIGAFAVAWVAGLVVPGAPGGIGVFEATALGLLQNQLPSGVIFGAVATYRLISTGAEALGGLVPERWGSTSPKN